MHVHSHKQEDDKVISEGGRAHFQEPYWTPANSTSGFKNLTCCFCSLSPPFTFLSLHILFGENRDPMHAQNFHFGPQDRHLLCNPFSPANTLSLSSLYHTDGHNHTFSQLRHIYMFPHFDNNQTLEEQTLILFHASPFTKQIKSSTKQVPQSVSAQDSNKKQVSPACSTYCIKTSYYHQHQMLSLLDIFCCCMKECMLLPHPCVISLPTSKSWMFWCVHQATWPAFLWGHLYDLWVSFLLKMAFCNLR